MFNIIQVNAPFFFFLKKSLKITKLGLKTLTLKAGMKGLRDIHLTVKRFTIMPVGINIEWFTGIIPTARQFQAVCTNQGLRSSSKGVFKEQERSFAEDR